MSTIAPSWTDNVQVLAPWAVIKGENVRTTYDLRTKRGAQLFVGIGFGGGTDLAGSTFDVLIRRVLNNGSASRRYAAGTRFSAGIDPCIRLINNGAGYSAGATSIAYDGHTGRTAVLQDKWFFWGVTAIPTATGALSPTYGCEIHRTSKGVTTPLVIDSPLAYAHADNEYIGLAESWSIWLPGGSLYELIFDYGGCSAGEAIACMADAQEYASDSVT